MEREPPVEQDHTPGDGGLVLVVCTANVCRSPYIERRLAQLVGHLGITVISRGTRALVDQPMDPAVASALEDHDASAQGFAARQLTPADVTGADLVITAAREHRAEVVRMSLRAMARCFTLLDLVDLANGLGPVSATSVPPGVPWVPAMTARLAAQRGLVPPRPASDADLRDPTGLGTRAHSRMVREVEGALPALAACLTPLPDITSRRR